MTEPYKFAKLYDTDTGQILITIINYQNAGEVSIQFNDGNEGIHKFNLVFGNEEQYKAQELFDKLDQSSAMQIIQKAIYNASIGITEGCAAELSDLFAVTH